jgi:choice-of-anchor B domain-containing protein
MIASRHAGVWLALLAAVPTAHAQQLGSAVAVDETDVLIGQPATARGPGVVYVYRPDGNSWTVAARLQATAEPSGDGFGASLALDGSTLLVAAGPESAAPAYVFERDASGVWREAARLVPDGLAGAGAPARFETPAALIQALIQGPVRRTVALGGGVALVANWGGDGRNEAAYVYRTRGGAAARDWEEEARLAPAEAAPGMGFGASMAMSGDLVVVGAPRAAERGGAAYVFARDSASGTWKQAARLAPDSLGANAGFGSAVAVVSGTILVGAPGEGRTGVVFTYARTAQAGTWVGTERLAPRDSAAGRFGSAIAVRGAAVLIGAPRADDGRGAIYGWSRDPYGRWLETGKMAGDGFGPRDGFAAALALGPGVAVVGAPSQDYGMGGAVVFRREAGAWAEAAQLRGDDDSRRMVRGEVPCADGRSSDFACQNVDLLAFLPVSAIGGGRGVRVSDMWGWTDGETGREYALVGRTDGTAFVDVTDPSDPVYVGELPAPPSGARDIKVYADHAFVVADGAIEHGMQVFALRRLRSVVGPPVTFEPDAVYDRLHSAHNLVINTETGFAFTVGSGGGGETCGGGLHMIDIRNPLAPTFAGCHHDPTKGLVWPGRTHDAQCVVYRGPDEEHREKELCFTSNETVLSIIDVTDKANPAILSEATYPGVAYVHQGWLTDDQQHFILDDEADELTGFTDGTRTLVFDVADLDDPVLLAEFRSTQKATDHNLYVKGDRVYQANYLAGMRVLDISDVAHPIEIGYFDTVPDRDEPGFSGGAWTAYPFFESGVVAVSSMRDGLFLLRPRPDRPVP